MKSELFVSGTEQVNYSNNNEKKRWILVVKPLNMELVPNGNCVAKGLCVILVSCNCSVLLLGQLVGLSIT